jgi:trehalose 6-phosphate phosphatase
MRFAHGHPGVLVKSIGLALPIGAVRRAASDVRAFADRRVRGRASYRRSPATITVEFVPVGTDKGRAVRR